MNEENKLITGFLLEADELKKTYLEKRLTKNEVVYLSVDQTTIRSFHHAKECSKKYQPLSIFRYWAWTFLSEEEMNERLKTRNFPDLREHAYGTLTKFWATADEGTPSFAQFNKLIDLFFKHLCLLDDLSEEDREFLYNKSYVPLDKYSLGFLGKVCPEMGIPSKPSMGFVSELNYHFFQNKIAEICANVAPMAFDLYAWNKSANVIPSVFKLIPLKKKKHNS